MKKKQSNTSWESVSSWYNHIVSDEGHYYHRHVIFPKLLLLLALQENGKDSLLDLACGQGVLSRVISAQVPYVGVDASASLVASAQKINKKPLRSFYVADLTRPLQIKEGNFSHATIILALQNIQDPLQVLKNASSHLCGGGKLYIVLNHPCFRIARQSSWEVDEENNIQYRRIDRYLSPLSIPIKAHPSQGERSAQTITYHRSLSNYSLLLKEAGFMIELIEEWCSDKTSTGGKAKMENRARAEIPMFLAIVAKKI